jgi:hypothetical protein
MRQGRRGVREEGRTGIEGGKCKVSVGGLLHPFSIVIYIIYFIYGSKKNQD